MSRFVFSTPRVRNLLGLRNLEIRDLDTSSLDAVLLGRPHVLMLPGGVLQIQSLYEGTRGPGAARLLGVTVYLNGRAGLGPDIDSAVRQALNSPPQTSLLPPPDPIVVGTPVKLAFRVKNARREVITITSAAGTTTKRLELETGRGTVRWVPPVAGDAQVRDRGDRPGRDARGGQRDAHRAGQATHHPTDRRPRRCRRREAAADLVQGDETASPSRPGSRPARGSSSRGAT